MRYLPNSSEMKRMDAHTIQTVGIPSIVLMEHAAQQVVSAAEGCLDGQSLILVLSGSGNNGADGLAVARLLHHKGYRVMIAVVGNPDHATEEWKIQRRVCENLEIAVYGGNMSGEALRAAGFTVLIDSLFGTGLSREVSGGYADAIRAINDSGIFTVSVDIPSGISSDTGKVCGCAVKASLTVAIHAEKLGMALYPGHEYCGRITVHEKKKKKKSVRDVNPAAFTLDENDLASLPERPAYSNKGTFGKLLIVAGCKDMAGAAYLSALAAYRSGAGLVRIFTVEENRVILQQLVPEAVMTTYPSGSFPEEALSEALAWATAVIAGPGLGRSDESRQIISFLVRNAKVPMLIDADGLNIMSEDKALLSLVRDNMILTPHLGEMARLSGKPVREIAESLPETAAAFTERTGAVMVLKDARTVVALPGGRLYVNTCGNSGMATGGSGDVLTGSVGGMLAAGADVCDAAVYGVLRHSLAGDAAAAKLGERAVTARDIADMLR